MLKNWNRVCILFVFLIQLSCNQKSNQQAISNQLKVVDAIGYQLPEDSIIPAKIITIDNSKLQAKLVNQLETTIADTSSKLAGRPIVIIPSSIQICKLGKDSFLIPKKMPVVDSAFVAGIPEVMIVKDAANKEQNPKNFSIYGKLQGLKHGIVNCIIQDTFGNLWFGTDGGATKYDGKNFTTLTDKEGLAHSSILSMLKDKKGNIWFSGFGGVTKYDGKYVTIYNTKNGLCSNNIRCIVEDKNENLWFGSYGNGVSMFNGKEFINYTTKEGLISNNVTSLMQHTNGDIWLGTANGLSIFNGNFFSNYKFKNNENENSIRCFMQDKKGAVWIGTNAIGLIKYEKNTFKNFTVQQGLISNTVLSIIQDKDENIWIGTLDGISKYDASDFTNFNAKDGLIENKVTSILQDKESNLWFGTSNGGVTRFNGNQFISYTEKEGLRCFNVRSIIQDNDNLWFGSNKKGLVIFNGKTFKTFNKQDSLFGSTILCLLKDKNNNVWISNYGVGIIKYDGKYFTTYNLNSGLPNSTVWSMIEDKDGNIWFGTDNGLSKYNGTSFTNYTTKQGLSDNVIWSLLQDKIGNIWIGTYTGGVNKFDGKTFVSFTQKQGLTDNTVRSIIEDKVGNIWFGTYGGITKYDGNRIEAIEKGDKYAKLIQQDLKKVNGKYIKTFTHFTEKDGLSNNAILSALQCKNGNIIFGTRFGLSILKVKNIEVKKQNPSLPIFKNYTYDDGFLGIGCNANAICETKDGTIWIGANDRLTKYNSSRTNYLTDTTKPNLQLTNIALFNQNIAWADLEKNRDTTLILANGLRIKNFDFNDVSKWYNIPNNLSLAYNNNFLSFNFIGITSSQPKKVTYQYMLEGIDDDWSVLSTRNEAPYGNLPSGNYKFKVKAMNSDGIWSSVLEYPFAIRPPWWKTWWFRALCLIVLVAASIFYIKWRESDLIFKQKKLELVVEQRTLKISEQKQLIEQKHKEITDSINYAERIQRSFLATTEQLDLYLKDYFIFFQPKDVVSGDFYWCSLLSNNDFAFVTADSTGHGVPGAIMSLLNISSLERAVEQNVIEPADILNHARKTIINRLKKDGTTEGGKDGMDCSLLCFNLQSNSLKYAAANNPVWIVRENEVIELTPDKMPVGKHEKDSISFVQHIVQLQKGDTIYALTDGFPDQFGGEKSKKFMSKNLRELLAVNTHLPMLEQKQLLEKTFKEWKGNLEQVDDVTVIGIRI
jgi:ligand-binding sensor domain-containing protein/serine phosphatase RsbU (regulator of sigma subunit)